MLYIAQAAVAIALLVGLPFVLDPPATDEHMIAAALAAHGVVGYVRSRKPKSYPDSVMPPVEPPKP